MDSIQSNFCVYTQFTFLLGNVIDPALCVIVTEQHSGISTYTELNSANVAAFPVNDCCAGEHNTHSPKVNKVGVGIITPNLSV